MKIHQLKIEQNYLDNILLGLKKSEIRLNDRDYQTGDVLEFNDYSKIKVMKYCFAITHIHSGLGLERNYVVLSLKGIPGSAS